MKKALSLLLCLVMVLSLTACGNSSTEVVQTSSETTQAAQETQNPKKTEEPVVESDDPTPQPPAVATSETSAELVSGGALISKNDYGTFYQYGIVEIENTGDTNIIFGNASFDVEDEDGTFIAAEKYVNVYPQIIEPGEKAYLYSKTLSDYEVEGSYRILPNIEYSEAKVDLIRYPIVDVTMNEDQYSTIKLKGRVENNTDEDISYIYVASLLFSKDNEFLGAIYTILTDNVRPGDKIGFELDGYDLSDHINYEDIYKATTFAYPYQYQFNF